MRLAAGDKVKIYLIRHGISIANEQIRYAGTWDVPLSENGVRDVEMKRDAGLYPKKDGIRLITSGMRRTEETLRIIYGDAEHEAIDAFREMNFGSFEQKTYYDLKDDERYSRWLDDKTGLVRCPDGECRHDVAERVIPAFYDVLHGGRDSLVVMHGGTISVVMSELFPSDNQFLAWCPKAAEGYVITAAGGATEYTPLSMENRLG